MSYAAVLSNFSVFEDICEIPFSRFIKAKAEIFCGSKTMFDGAAEKTTLSQADLEVGCTSFFPPTVRVHHCLGCSSQKWQQRVTLKGPQVQQPEKSLGWLWQNATKEEGRGFDKTTTLKCSRSLRQTQKKCTYCFPALSLTHSVLSVSLNLSSKTEEIYNVHTIHFWVCMPFIHPNNLYIHFYFYLLVGLYSYEAYLWMNASKFYIAHHS